MKCIESNRPTEGNAESPLLLLRTNWGWKTWLPLTDYALKHCINLDIFLAHRFQSQVGRASRGEEPDGKLAHEFARHGSSMCCSLLKACLLPPKIKAQHY